MSTSSQHPDGHNAPAPTPVPATIRQAVVLVVDDDPAITRMIVRALARHRVTSVNSAAEALALVDEGRTFDLLFCDVHMPVMDGMALHAAIATRSPELASRVVFLSGGVAEPRLYAALDALPNKRLDKPFELSAVRALADACVLA